MASPPHFLVPKPLEQKVECCNKGPESNDTKNSDGSGEPDLLGGCVCVCWFLSHLAMC